MTHEGLRLKLLKYYRLAFAKTRRKELKNTKFTIISNNCWGGMVYESYDLPKESPTTGLFFMASDYIKFLSDIKGYLAEELVFIDPKDSKYIDFLKSDKRFGSYPIGMLGDIEIMFLHYHSQQEVKEKWERRIKRISWDKLIVKFNDQNECTADDVKAFAKLPYKHKLFFTIKDWPVAKWGGYCKIRQHTQDSCVTASHEPFGKNRYVDLTKLINSL